VPAPAPTVAPTRPAPPDDDPAPRRDPARRAAILEAAASVFARSGYAATAMEDVAAASGVTKLIVYRHFASKEALYRAVLERVFDRQLELFLENMAAGLEAGGATRALLSVGRESADGFRLLWRHAAREPQFAPYVREFRDAAVDPARAVVEPFLARAYVEWAAQTLFDHLVDAVLNWLDHGAPAADEDFIALEAASLRATVAAWAATFPR
jgi:AcrR family transcriptional regulator